ncbi:unnamed protein product [Jaminaea pallidilutea]
MFSWLPADSPLNEPLFSYAFCGSLLVQHTLFHVLSHTILSGSDTTQLKRRAWILTTFNGVITSLAALPFLWDLLVAGFDLHAIRFRTPFARTVCAFFVAYLLSDLGLGSVYYRKLINLSSGWIHHTVYTGLFLFWVHKGWDHIVVMACIFELPTFIMGIACIHPPLRSNVAFTTTFFLTRVFMHLGLILSAVSPHGRAAPRVNGSWGPSVSLVVTYPMHLWWGYKCILSVRRRMHKRRLAARAEREKTANEFANVAGQAFNGFGAPDMHSAVNTPLPTPGLSATNSPFLSASNAANTYFTGSPQIGLHAAFAKAAAAASRSNPMNLVTSRKSSPAMTPLTRQASTDSIDLLQLPPQQQAPGGNVEQQPRSSYEAVRNMPSGALSAPVPPEGAHSGSREPFLAIRSAAEGRDRARRLVADAVRKLWFGAPDTWRRQFEEEAKRMEARSGRPQGRLSRAKKSLTDPSDTEWEDSGSGEDAVATEDDRSHAQRARAMLRRGVLRAVRRAVNGRAQRDEDEAVVVLDGGEEETIDSVIPGEGLDARIAAEQVAQTDRALRSLELSTILRLSGLPLPPDLTGDPYEVRPLEVERRQGETRQRFVGDLRRRMEVRARDVVQWD